MSTRKTVWIVREYDGSYVIYARKPARLKRPHAGGWIWPVTGSAYLDTPAIALLALDSKIVPMGCDPVKVDMRIGE